MKAYEMKVSIKGAHPPIWRKIAVPCGITFQQLSNTIQIAFGWSGLHLFEFDFPNAVLTNDKEACEEYRLKTSAEWKKMVKEKPFLSLLPPAVKTLYAADVKIDKYMLALKFKYIYDFGDWWEHNIEVVSVLDDYANDFPQVTKFKGVCPPEDCGGIEGFYDFMKIWQDKNHPEYEEMCEWANQQCFSNEYDMEDANDELEFVLDDNIDLMNELF